MDTIALIDQAIASTRTARDEAQHDYYLFGTQEKFNACGKLSAAIVQLHAARDAFQAIKNAEWPVERSA